MFGGELENNVIDTFLDNSEFHDIVIKLENENETELIYVHKFILSSKNYYFKCLFENGMKESTEKIITIKDVDIQLFRIILAYIYNCESGLMFKSLSKSMTYIKENICSLLELCQRFQVNKLEMECKNSILDLLCVKNALDLFHLTIKYSWSEEIQMCAFFIM